MFSVSPEKQTRSPTRHSTVELNEQMSYKHNHMVLPFSLWAWSFQYEWVIRHLNRVSNKKRRYHIEKKSEGHRIVLGLIKHPQMSLRASLVAQSGKESTCNVGNLLKSRRYGFIPWVRKIPCHQR